MTKFFGKAETVLADLATTLANPDQLANLPKLIKEAFTMVGVPADKWSVNNRIITAMQETSDARGFKQWLAVGRAVKKGGKSFAILSPCVRKIEDKTIGEDKTIIFGFKSVNVFAIDQTEIKDVEKWSVEEKKISIAATEKTEFFNSLPFIDVARAWGINTEIANTRRKSGANAMYGYNPINPSASKNIVMGVKNVDTWLHELAHAADHINGTLTQGGGGQKIDNEVVAEVASTALALILGYDRQTADLAGCYTYVRAYAAAGNMTAGQATLKFFSRISAVMQTILDEAEGLQGAMSHAA